MKHLFLLFVLLLNACSVAQAEEIETMNDRAHARPPKFGWAQSGTMTPVNANSSVNLQKEFPVSGEYTVQFQVNGPDESNTATGTRIVRASVTWAINGNPITRIIDVVNGTSISGISESVDVRVFDASQGTGLSPYTVIVTCSQGARPKTQQPPYLNAGNFSIAAAGGTISSKVPIGAGATCVFVTVVPSALDGAIPEFDALVSHNSGQGALKSYNPRIAEWVPLASGTTAIQLQTGPASPATTWSITYGIDG
jgi:hypothetical protein